jgi:hypothetical protein
MSEPSYGSGRSYEQQQGYGGGYGQQYGGQPGQPYGTGQQPQQPPYGGGYGPQPGPAGHPSGGYPSTPAPSPSAPRAASDRMALVATLVTIVGYVCAGAGVLGFILWLAVDGNGTYRFAAALETLVVGIGLGGLNYAVGTWLATRDSGSSR